jgi:tetratricopeptide (TPR) repeat protein
MSGFTAIINLLGTLIVACSVQPTCAQIDSADLVDRSQVRQMVSKNQLLTPGKAMKEAIRAREDFIRGHYESAQKKVDRALVIAPNCAIALTLRGVLDLQNGHTDEATNSFQEAIDNDPTLAAAYMGLAAVLISQKHFKEAVAPLDRATGLLPGFWYTHFQTGLAQLGLVNTEAALK